MPRVTTKGQITIPKNIRNSFGFLPGMEVDVIAEGSKIVLVKGGQDNNFLKWLGRGGRRKKQRVDTIGDQLRGRIDE